MAYNTGNPLGSVAPKDLFDNAQNLDAAVNTQASRSFVDRLGKTRRTYWGMEQDFKDFITASGFVNLGAYGAGLVISNFNQTFLKDGLAYRAAPALVLPYTTTGVWGTEGASFVIAGDSTLRQDLAAPTGAALLGYRLTPLSPSLTIEAMLRASGMVNALACGAVGDGVADDTAAIIAAEAIAFAMGGTLLLPSGGTFKFSSTLALRVPLEGFGATLLNSNATEKPLRTDAKITITNAKASVKGLTVLCNHKCVGISAQSIAAAVVEDVVVVDSIVAGVSFTSVGNAVAKNIFASDVRCDSIGLDAADGVHAVDCNSFVASSISAQGFQRSAVFARQTVAGNFVANIERITASGGNYPYGVSAPLAVGGVLIESMSSCLIDGVVVSGMPTSTATSGSYVCAIAISNNAATYTPVIVIDRLQIDGLAVGGNLSTGVFLFGLQKTAIVSISTVDIQRTKCGVLSAGGVSSLTIDNFVGRNMNYSDADHALLQLGDGYSGIDSITLSNITDKAPARSGTGAKACTINLSATATKVLVKDCATPISFKSTQDSLAQLSFSNCLSINALDSDYPLANAANVSSVNSFFFGLGAASKLLGAGVVANFQGGKITNFHAQSDEPLAITFNGAALLSSPLSIGADTSTINACSFVHTISGSPIVFGSGFTGGYRCNISAINIDMVDGAAYPISRGGASTPANFLISGVQWSGGMSDVTNFNLSNGAIGTNRKTP